MNDFVELKKIITILLKGWWLLLLLGVIAAMVSYFATQKQPTVYKATTTIMVGQSIKTTEITREGLLVSEVLAQTYAEMVRRQPVLEGVVKALGLDKSWQSLKGQVRVRLVEGTQLLQIEVEADSSEEAQIVADEVAHQLILLSPTSIQNREKEDSQQFVRQRLENLQTKIGAGQQRLESLESLMASSLTAEQVQELQKEINTLESLIADWENTHTQLLIFIESNKSPNQLVVIEPAQVVAEPPPTELFTLIGGFIGVIIGAGVLFLLDFLDDTVKSMNDLSSLNLAVLGTVGRIDGKLHQQKLVAVHDPFNPTTEAFRMLRSNIQFLTNDVSHKSILVTSPTPSEGKSTTVANLAVVMAQAGYKTMVVDADLRQPTLHKVFQVSNMEGLTDLLRTSELDIADYVKPTAIENLHILTSGRLPPNPSELLGSSRMRKLLAALEQMADIIIYDSPPVLIVTDSSVLANQVEGVILVVRAGQTQREAVKQAAANLQYANATIMGCILNQVQNKGFVYHSRRFYKIPSQLRPNNGIAFTKLPHRWRLPFN